MNPFQTLAYIQEMYKTYVYTFQKIKNPVIRDSVGEKIARVLRVMTPEIGDN